CPRCSGVSQGAMLLSRRFKIAGVASGDRAEWLASMKDGPYESLRKAFEVLELLAARSPRGVTEIASALGIQKSGASRLLKALSGWGYVVQDLKRGQYQSGPRVLALAEHHVQG